MPRLSIVTPFYRAAAYIGPLLESVKAQTFTDFEHLVVDDGSPDDSAEIVRRRIAADARFRLVQQENQGAIAARLHGYRLTDPDTEYVFFVDADDVLHPEMLERMLRYLDARPEVGLAYCDVQHIDEQGTPIEKRVLERYVPTRLGVRALRPDEADTPFVSVLCWAPILETVAVMRRTAYDAAGGWDPHLGHHGEGVDLFSRIALRAEVHFVNEVLYFYRRHPGQSTARTGIQEAQEQRVREKFERMEGVPDEYERLVRDVLIYQDLRLGAFLGFKAGVERLRRGEVKDALTFMAGAAIRYVKSFGTGIDYRALNEQGGRARSGKA